MKQMNFAIKSQETPNNSSLSQNRLALSKVDKKTWRKKSSANEWKDKKKSNF